MIERQRGHACSLLDTRRTVSSLLQSELNAGLRLEQFKRAKKVVINTHDRSK